MKETLAELERWGADVIFGRARGFRAGMTRLAMSALSFVFRGLVALRLLIFRKRWKQQAHLGTHVISIGNITVGGTGKTPVTEMLAKTLRDRGRKVAILSRGYKSRRLKETQKWKDSEGQPIDAEDMPKVVSDGRALLLDSKYAGDEPFMLARNLDGVSVVVDKDRIKGGRFAVRQLEADTLVLDDGLQYLRLAHGTDIVLVDKTAPYGTGHLLPRGTLREPPANLCRASYILITKCDGTPNDTLIEELRRHNRFAPIIECTHGPRYLEELFTGRREDLEFLRDKWVAAISGIAVPESFERSIERLGARVEIRRHFPDHYRFTRKEVDAFMTRCIERDMELVVTTEKDAVRFPRPTDMTVPIWFLRIEVEILKGHDEWEEMIDRMCLPHAPGDPVLRFREAYAV
ncbi:tetraacyldisaccharide 4'-kinase [Haloferula sp. A504]|uniref:tetraacyldisaccharide 4'-kinase n=1 Tax=Haloferula sp. A504 TaxID=3373601 RepID=UPI0031C3BBF3|nr:tetraacyldisaccharide 4'-kinase [Verrucomicrobiaceae bacterium E54]